MADRVQWPCLPVCQALHFESETNRRLLPPRFLEHSAAGSFSKEAVPLTLPTSCGRRRRSQSILTISQIFQAVAAGARTGRAGKEPQDPTLAHAPPSAMLPSGLIVFSFPSYWAAEQ